MVFAAIAGQAYAESELEEKVKVLSVMKKYSEAVACGTTFEVEESLEPFLKDTYTVSYDPDYGSTYYVLWGGDVGCNGGSGTHSYYISEVGRYSDSRPFLVLNDNAFGELFSLGINSRFIESVKMVGSRHFVVVSSEFSEGDANNFPSLKYQYALKYQGAEWKVTDKKLLKDTAE